MSDELDRLEAERVRLINMARSHERQKQVMTSVMMAVAVVILGVVLLLLINAVWTGQLSVLGFFWAAVAAALLSFILSRKLRSETREVTIADVLSGVGAEASEDPIRAQIAEHEMRIARLKAGERP